MTWWVVISPDRTVLKFDHIGRSQRRVVPKLLKRSSDHALGFHGPSLLRDFDCAMELLLGGFYYNLGKGPFRGMVAKRPWPQGPCWGEPGTLWQSKRDREKMVIVGDCPLSLALLQQSHLATVNMMFAVFDQAVDNQHESAETAHHGHRKWMFSEWC